MKKLLLTSLVLCSLHASFSQTNFFSKNLSLKRSETSESFSRALQSVLEDYPNNFHTISGTVILEQGEVEQFESTIMLPGSETCIIGRYHSVIDTTASFQAFMFRSEEFEAAAKQYRILYKQIKGSPVVMVDGSKLYLTGEYSEPDNSLDFSVSTFTFPSHDRRFMGFRIELELVYTMNEWAVHINMGKKKGDEEE